MLTPVQAFKTAFLLRCADEGLTLEQTHARVKQALHATAPAEKAASLLSRTLLGGTGGAAVGGAPGAVIGASASAAAPAALSAAPWALALGLGIPAGLGWAGGKMLAETRKDPLTVDEAKTNEELAEIQRLTDRAQRMKQLRHQQHLIGG